MLGQHGISNGEATELRPVVFLEAHPDAIRTVQEDGRTGLIILNSPISDYKYFQRIYAHASFRLCADGGANRLHDLASRTHRELTWEEALRTVLPDIIHGDLDSLDDSVRQRYEKLGVTITKDPDQYSTDFGKAVKVVTEQLPNVRDILIFGSVGGRVDQGIGLLGELYREQITRHPEVRFWLFSESNVTTLLRPGTTIIHTPLESGLIEKNIGILPLYGPGKISTKGLEWDVEDWPTQIGGQVSTSNHIVAPQISITTDLEMLFTVERKIVNEPRQTVAGS
ncbi:Hypothetical protein R9X50_00089200 [Acrodontium crateriforme]|uniref:Thiamine pyrophosphokinase n=1 Tax=Acrodontium crateriforme TaxID=150365 RepID=A0AAQ3LY23_9PEZI|nr:Hypothetical protein R9X50_00089200 [Acrodontium crateriforme]